MRTSEKRVADQKTPAQTTRTGAPFQSRYTHAALAGGLADGEQDLWLEWSGSVVTATKLFRFGYAGARGFGSGALT